MAVLRAGKRRAANLPFAINFLKRGGWSNGQELLVAIRVETRHRVRRHAVRQPTRRDARFGVDCGLRVRTVADRRAATSGGAEVGRSRRTGVAVEHDRAGQSAEPTGRDEIGNVRSRRRTRRSAPRAEPALPASRGARGTSPVFMGRLERDRPESVRGDATVVRGHGPAVPGFRIWSTRLRPVANSRSRYARRRTRNGARRSSAFGRRKWKPSGAARTSWCGPTFPG